MSSTLDVIARRYACRAYQDTPVPAETLALVAQAGVCAPSAMNRQPWRLTVVTDPDAIAAIGRVGLENLRDTDPAGYERVLGRGGALLYNAPAMILISTVRGDGPYTGMDVGIVAATVALAATSLGLGTCIAGMPARAFEGPAGEALAAKYLPEGYDFRLSVLLGFEANPGGTPHVPDLTKITYV